jgi:hypothetical protein
MGLFLFDLVLVGKKLTIFCSHVRTSIPHYKLCQRMNALFAAPASISLLENRSAVHIAAIWRVALAAKRMF